MINKILYSDENTCIEYFYSENKDIKKIAFVFSPSMNRELTGFGFGGSFLLNNGFDLIAFKLVDDSWFQNIPDRIFNDINKIVGLRNYEKRIGYGSSMGGFAAIVFSKALKLNIVLAISPQYSIVEDFDKRWHDFSRSFLWNYNINALTVSKNTHFHLIFDNKNLDFEHIKKIEYFIPLENLHKYKFPFSGHPTTHFLAEVNYLKDLCLNIININPTYEFSYNFNLKKKYSKSYLFNLSMELLKRNKFVLALSAIEKAIEIDAKNNEFFIHKASIYEKKLDFSNAIDCVNSAISLSSSNAQYFNYLSRLLIKINKIEESITAASMAIKFDLTKNPQLDYHLSNLYFLNGDIDNAITQIDIAISKNPNNKNFIDFKKSLLTSI